MEKFEPREGILGNSQVEVRVANNSFGGKGRRGNVRVGTKALGGSA